jgi:hypothetical protein
MPRMSRKSAEVFARLLPPDERADYVERVAYQKNSARVVGGRVADAAGKALERRVAQEHDVAAALGVARMRKVGAPVFVGDGGVPVGWAGHGPADYQGFVRASGAWWRPCAVEAKSREGRMQRDDLGTHQRDDLALVESVGGLALVFVQLTDDRSGQPLGAWAVEWGALERLWKVSRRAKPGKAGSPREEDHIVSRSVGPEELEGWEAAPGCYLRRWAR